MNNGGKAEKENSPSEANLQEEEVRSGWARPAGAGLAEGVPRSGLGTAPVRDAPGPGRGIFRESVFLGVPARPVPNIA